MKIKYFLSALMLSVLSANAVALVDRDNDGLIEINNLDDLNEIRNDLEGTSLRGESSGCPTDGCFGYELTRDLDFDTNGNGVIDNGDWNNGQSWVPIAGTVFGPSFQATLNGNFHTVRHLTIQQIDDSYDGYGLIGTSHTAEIRNIGLLDSSIGVNTTTDNYTGVGSLIGKAVHSKISSVYAKNTNSSASGRSCGIGGLIGDLGYSELKDSYATGTVNAANNYHAGGLVADAYTSLITNSYAQVRLAGKTINLGGLVGEADNTGITNSFSNSVVSAGVSPDDLGGVSGGLVGSLTVSGLAPDERYVIINNSYALGSITAQENNIAGGLIGRVSTPRVKVYSHPNSQPSQIFPSRPLLINYSYSKNLIQKGSYSYANLIGPGINGEIVIKSSYWVKDPAGVVLESDNLDLATGGHFLADMQCANNPVNNTCAKPNLFKNWNKNVWDFGTDSQLPALKLKSNFSWYSTDTAGGTGDFESIARMKEHKPEYACDTPTEFFAKEKRSAYVFNAKTSEKFRSFNAIDGLVCVHADQVDGQCKNYKVSYLCDLNAAHTPFWTPWQNGDSPNGNGDYENNAPACAIGIRARVVGDDTSRNGAPQNLAVFNLGKGLTCKNDDNADGCKDYEVRMTCDVLGDRQ